MTARSLFAWAAVGITLAIFADIDTTSELAVAFAWLVLIAVLFNSGTKVFTNINAVVGGKATTK